MRHHRTGTFWLITLHCQGFFYAHVTHTSKNLSDKFGIPFFCVSDGWLACNTRPSKITLFAKLCLILAPCAVISLLISFH